MTHFLGIDGGGTKTEAVLIDAAGREIARAACGPANVHTVGQQAAEAALQGAIDGVLSAGGRTAADVAAIGLGLAGAGRTGDRAIARAMLSRIAPRNRAIVTHDAEIALIGGAGRRYGIVLIAGTGAIAYGVNAQDETQRADGWGYLLGDGGSAYWIGRQGLRAALRAHDGRGPNTALSHLLASALGITQASDWVERVYSGGFGAAQVAALAPFVRDAACDGDAAAGDILRGAGERLSRTLGAVIRGLEMNDERFPVVLAGGLFQVKDLLRETIVTSLDRLAPRAQAIEPRHDAAYGAALLAMQEAR
jgi:N-acetylglucosamine kinase-like BadF-type ATPase